jgi:hypothetical protein
MFEITIRDLSKADSAPFTMRFQKIEFKHRIGVARSLAEHDLLNTEFQPNGYSQMSLRAWDRGENFEDFKTEVP